MEVTLIWSNRIKNANGFPEEEDASIEVCAEEKEVRYSEFYESMRNGIQVSRIFEVRIEDYELSLHRDSSGRKLYAAMVESDGERYKIIRTYKIGKAKIQLTCGDA